MKLIHYSANSIIQEPGLEGIYKACAEAAYISTQNNPDTARLAPEEFLRTVIIPKQHNRVLEFGTIYLKIPEDKKFYGSIDLTDFFSRNPWSKVNVSEGVYPKYYAVTTNYRVIIENSLEDLIDMFLCEPTEFHLRRHTIDFICSRGVGDDFRTHITLSSIMESSRYCNYSKDKFNNELTFIDPYWKFKESYEYTLKCFEQEEKMYLDGVLNHNMEPQEAKRIYPLGAKVQLRLCGFLDAWNNFFLKRNHVAADPECRFLAKNAHLLIYNIK